MCSHRPGTEDAVHVALEPPPDSWAAHVDELPKPGSRVFAAQNALALALIYASMDPEVRKEVDNLRDDVQKLASQNENLEAYSKMMYLAACQAQLEASQLQGQASTLSQKVRKTAKQLEDAQQEILNANERVRSALEKRAASAAEAGELRRQLQGAIAELNTAASERDAGRTQLLKAKMATEEGHQHHSSAVAQLQVDIALFKDEQRANREEIETVMSQLRDAQNLGKTLVTQKAALVSELDVVKAARDALKESNGLLKTDLLGIREELDTLRGQLQDAKSQQSALAAERDELETGKRELSIRSDALGAENHTLRLHLSALRDERGALADRLRDQESKRAALETECRTLRIGRDDAKAEVDKLTGERYLLARAHSVLQDDHRSLQGERATLLDQLRNAEKTLKTEHEELAAARAGFAKERDTLTAQLAMSQSLCKDHLLVKAALHDAQGRAEACNAKLEVAEAEVHRMQRALGEAARQVEEWSTKCQNGERERGALQKDLETSTEDCRRLRKDLTTLEKSIKDEKSLPSRQHGTVDTDEVKQLEAQIGQLRNSVVFWKAKSQTTIKGLAAEQERRKALDAKLKAERAETESTLAASRQAMDGHKRDVAEARGERDALSSERDALLREKDVLIASRDAVGAECDSLNRELESARAQVEESQAKLQTEIATRAAEAAKREELESTIGGLKSALLAHHQLVEDWKQEAEAAWKERAGALKERDAVIKVRGKSKADLATERDGIAAERDKLSAEHKDLVAERDNLVSERDKVAAELAQVSKALEDDRSVHQTTLQTLATHTTLLQEKEKQVNYLVPRVAELQNQLDLLEPHKDLRKQLLEVAKLRKSLAAARVGYKEAAQQADWRRYEIGRLQKELLEETEKHAQSQIKNLDLEAKLVELKSMKSENTRLTQKIEKLDHYVHDLRNRLDELRQVRVENMKLCKQIDELENPKRKIARPAA